MFTDCAGCCTQKTFLAGQFQDLIARDFGPQVLEEVIAAVRGYLKEP